MTAKFVTPYFPNYVGQQASAARFIDKMTTRAIREAVDAGHEVYQIHDEIIVIEKSRG